MADFSALGAGLGGLLGASDADSGPSGYTTSTNFKREAIPAWLLPYVQQAISGGNELFSGLREKPSPILGASEDEMMKTIRGDYLSPESNPYLAAIAKNVSDITGRSIDSRFSSAGRYGSGAYADTVSSAISKNLAELYGTNYAGERGRQFGAASTAPAFVSGSVDARFAPFVNFLKLIPNLRDTDQAITEPFFKNKGAGILGGAMAGSQLGKMFGRGGGSDAGSGAPDGMGTGMDSGTGDWYGW